MAVYHQIVFDVLVVKSPVDCKKTIDILLTYLSIFMEVDNKVDNILIHFLLIHQIKGLSFKASWNYGMKHNGVK